MPADKQICRREPTPAVVVVVDIAAAIVVVVICVAAPIVVVIVGDTCGRCRRRGRVDSCLVNV